MTKIRSEFPQTPINLTLREEQISTILYCLEGYVQGNDDEELVEEIDEIFEVLEKTVDKFYAKIEKAKAKQPLNKHDILCATENYLSMCSDKNNKYCEWGDGDSLDRERVRDILLEEYNYKFVGE